MHYYICIFFFFGGGRELGWGGKKECTGSSKMESSLDGQAITWHIRLRGVKMRQGIEVPVVRD